MGSLRRAGTASSLEEVLSFSPSLFVFDWDDTLFPTTWHERERLEPEDAAKHEGLLEHARQLVAVLEACALVGQVIIVTLAARPWVADTTRKYFPPEVRECLDRLQVEVYYAREFKQPDPSEITPRQMINPKMLNATATAVRMEMLTLQKAAAMKQALRKHSELGKWKQLWAIGDGHFEMFAARNLAFQTDTPLVKTIKMYDEPDLQCLTDELMDLESSFEQILARTDAVHLDFDELPAAERRHSATLALADGVPYRRRSADDPTQSASLADLLLDPTKCDPHLGGGPALKTGAVAAMAASGAAKTAGPSKD